MWCGTSAAQEVSFYGLQLGGSDSESDSDALACLHGCDLQLLMQLANLLESDPAAAIEAGTVCPVMEPLLLSGCMDPCQGSPEETVLLPILQQCGLGTGRQPDPSRPPTRPIKASR
jgi:hypothetical protein